MAITTRGQKFQMGDIISQDGGCCENKVLAVLSGVFAMSETDNLDEFGWLMTELDAKYYELVRGADDEDEDEDGDEEDILVVTMDDIADAFEVDVDNLRIAQ